MARVLKQRLPKLLVVALEPRGSAVLSGGDPGLHAIQGLGAGFVPDTLDRSLVITVFDIAADKMMRRLAREEGLLVGTSAGANVFGALEVAARFPAQGGARARVITILCDGGERYLC